MFGCCHAWILLLSCPTICMGTLLFKFKKCIWLANLHKNIDGRKENDAGPELPLRLSGGPSRRGPSNSQFQRTPPEGFPSNSQNFGGPSAPEGPLQLPPELEECGTLNQTNCPQPKVRSQSTYSLKLHADWLTKSLSMSNFCLLIKKSGDVQTALTNF